MPAHQTQPEAEKPKQPVQVVLEPVEEESKEAKQPEAGNEVKEIPKEETKQ